MPMNTDLVILIHYHHGYEEWRDANTDSPILCNGFVRDFFDLPAGVEKAWLRVSGQPSRAAWPIQYYPEEPDEDGDLHDWRAMEAPPSAVLGGLLNPALERMLESHGVDGGDIVHVSLEYEG